MERDLSRFKASHSLRIKVITILWIVLQNMIFIKVVTPSSFRVFILRLFGAKVGIDVFIRSGVKVTFPWNLTIGNSTWIGEGVWFINHEEIEIGSNVCISQSVTVCSSGHDLRSESLDYKHKRIEIRDGAWICLRATVLAGSRVGVNSVISAGEVFVGNLSDEHIFVNGSSKPIENLC